MEAEQKQQVKERITEWFVVFLRLRNEIALYQESFGPQNSKAICFRNRSVSSQGLRPTTMMAIVPGENPLADPAIRAMRAAAGFRSRQSRIDRLVTYHELGIVVRD